jgi:serine/threonine protein kinase
MASFLPDDEGNYMSGLISSRKFLKFEDFEIDKFLQEGGYGKVYAATRKSDGKKVAMKFFGYTRQKPDVEEIRKEVALMIRLDKGRQDALQSVQVIEEIFILILLMQHSFLFS